MARRHGKAELVAYSQDVHLPPLFQLADIPPGVSRTRGTTGTISSITEKAIFMPKS